MRITSLHKPAREPLVVPPRLNALREIRTVLDLGRMTLPLLGPAGAARAKRRRNIIVLPGFGAGDQLTWPLRRYLAKLGHHAEGWGLGVNRAGMDIPHRFDELPDSWRRVAPTGPYRQEGSVPMLCERMRQHVSARQQALGGKLTLIGWSLGGLVAREVARDLPEVIEQVITLGTPVQGGPKYTAAATYFRKIGMDLDWIECELTARECVPIRAPITAIISPSDGVVGHTAAYDQFSPNVTHVELDAAHIGLCFNPQVWKLISKTLNGVA